MTTHHLAQNASKESVIEELKQCCLQKNDVIMWKMAFGQKWSTPLQLKVVRTQVQELLFEASLQEKENIKTLMNGERVLKFYIPGKNILFQSKIKSFYFPELVVEIPSFIAIQDRRKFMRLTAPTEQVYILFNVTIKDSERSVKQTKKQLLDLSAGGFSILLHTEEAVTYNKSENTQHMILNLEQHQVSCAAKLVNQVTVMPNEQNKLLYKSIKCSYQFTHLKQEDQDAINDYVLDHLNLSTA